MWRERDSHGFRLRWKKTVISFLTVFLSRSFLCLITQIIETQRGVWLPQVAQCVVLLGVCVASVDPGREAACGKTTRGEIR